jgi:L-alanine-DL-glutamate epimerase-like enolase superfamily enzyme
MHQNPLDTAVLYNRLFHHHIKLGPDGGALHGALAAVDIALWDLKGKLLNQPIYQLLGGAWRTDLLFYASVGGNAHRSVDDVCRAVEARMQDNPTLVKIRFDGDKTKRDADLPGDIAKARAVRKLVGDNFPLAFDANNTYSVSGAIRVGRVLEELGYEWFEEPVLPYLPDAFAQVAGKLDIPIAAGEQEYTLRGIKQLIESGVSIVQPDIVKTGGFTGLSEMAALARAHGVELVPHQTQPTLGHVANLHFVCALPHAAARPVEYNVQAPSEQNVVLETPLLPQNGIFVVPSGPGLGLTFNQVELAKRVQTWRGANENV